MKHEFGGPWTKEKLQLLEKYLKAYIKIFKGNPQARYFKTIYVDAFAGSGAISLKTEDAARVEEEGVQTFLDGSVNVALSLDPGFDKYLFVEKHQGRCQELELLAKNHAAAEVEILNEDANRALTKFAASTDWRRYRAVVFLDPYGMQVDWSTIQALAGTKAVDLWILFPLSTVNRLLIKNELPPPEWGQALTRIFGTEAWKSRFYRKEQVVTLFEEYEVELKEADFEEIGQFFLRKAPRRIC